jgi:dienelactone hydrolase
MKPFLKLLTATLFCLPIISHATALTLTTKQGFELKTDYFQPKESTKRAVLLSHQCNSDRSMYKTIGEALGQKGIHALSLDFRWYGQSVSGKTDLKELAKLPAAERKNPWPMVMEHWPTDVQLAYDFLRKKVGDKGSIGVTGASCGGRQAKVLAETRPLKAMSFFSSSVVRNNDEAMADYKATIAKIPTLFISAEQDGTSAGTQKGFSLNENVNSKFISYKGDEHGEPLLVQDKILAKSMASWFDANLK